MRIVPPRPTSAPRLTEAARLHLGEAFQASGRRYDAIRPSYPAGVVDFLVPAGARTAVDLGAGTGLFTALLDAHGLEVTAVERDEGFVQACLRRHQADGVRRHVGRVGDQQVDPAPEGAGQRVVQVALIDTGARGVEVAAGAPDRGRAAAARRTRPANSG